MTNPYTLPNKPYLTMREILPWISSAGEVTLHDLIDRFGITSGDAAMRLNKLWKWGYLRRGKSPVPPRIYHYTVTKFGRRKAKEWK